MNLRNVNLNHLVVLRELLRTSNVTRAANNLGLTQSSVSGILAQLRATFSDDLLVASGRRLVLSERAVGLIGQVEALLAQTELLYEPDEFDPHVANGVFTLGTGLAALVVPFIERLAEEAPNVRVQAIIPDAASLRRLRQGQMDVLIAPPGNGEGRDIRHAFLFSDELVCIASRTNAQVPERIDARAYRSLPLAAYWPGANHPDVSERLGGNALPTHEPPVVRVPSLALLPSVVARSPYIALVPAGVLAKASNAADIRVVETAFKVPRVLMNMYWAERTHLTPFQIYARQVLQAIGDGLMAEQG
ncbi:MAG: LysR family transcriptional regulator [Rhodobiaceae bacterium]|nr:LysR family transcriptional regulator [Rhodobiaceae bacterium]